MKWNKFIVEWWAAFVRCGRIDFGWFSCSSFWRVIGGGKPQATSPEKRRANQRKQSLEQKTTKRANERSGTASELISINLASVKWSESSAAPRPQSGRGKPSRQTKQISLSWPALWGQRKSRVAFAGAESCVVELSSFWVVGYGLRPQPNAPRKERQAKTTQQLLSLIL